MTSQETIRNSIRELEIARMSLACGEEGLTKDLFLDARASIKEATNTLKILLDHLEDCEKRV